MPHIVAAARFAGAHQFRDIAEERGDGPRFLEASGSSLQNIVAALSSFPLPVKIGRISFEIGTVAMPCIRLIRGEVNFL
jgi:hypothetical protein